MTTLLTQATKWSEMPRINSVIEFSEADKDCLAEVRDVLKKYGNLDRFGISLLHTHFEVAPDEILLETTDEQKRTQIIRPVKKADLENRTEFSPMVTAMRLVEGEHVAVQQCTCGRDKDGHNKTHPWIPGFTEPDELP